MKSPLMERPIFHHLVHRVETHSFLCVPACHLFAAVEQALLDQGIHTSWASLREQLATHQVVTVVAPISDGQQICIRKATTPEPEHKKIYQVLRISDNLLDPARSRPIVTERTCKRLILRHRVLRIVEVGLVLGRSCIRVAARQELRYGHLQTPGLARYPYRVAPGEDFFRSGMLRGAVLYGKRRQKAAKSIERPRPGLSARAMTPPCCTG